MEHICSAYLNLSHVMRKPTFYICKNVQISFAVTAKLIRAFVFATLIVQCYFLNPKFPASSHLLYLYSLVFVGAGQKPHCWFSHEAALMLKAVVDTGMIKHLEGMSLFMKNQKFAYAKTKVQTSFAVTAKLISAFVFATWIVQSLFFLNPELQVF